MFFCFMNIGSKFSHNERKDYNIYGFMFHPLKRYDKEK